MEALGIYQRLDDPSFVVAFFNSTNCTRATAKYTTQPCYAGECCSSTFLYGKDEVMINGINILADPNSPKPPTRHPKPPVEGSDSNNSQTDRTTLIVNIILGVVFSLAFVIIASILLRKWYRTRYAGYTPIY